MFLSCHVFRTVFFGCVFATVFCVFCALALPNDVNPDDYATTSGIAGVSYVKDVVANKENTMNKVTSLTHSVTDVQYPSALAVYSSVSERVSTSSAANQSNIMLRGRFPFQIYHCPGQNEEKNRHQSACFLW